MGERRGAYRVLVGDPRQRDHLEDTGVDGRIILRWILWKWDRGGMDWIAHRIQVCVLNLMAMAHTLNETHFIFLKFCIVFYCVTC
jgi:hypothetical protein